VAISSEGSRLGEEAARMLARTGRHKIGPGLTDTEIARIEREYQVEFAEDHRAFLAAGLPLNRAAGLSPSDPTAPGRSGAWPDWRDGDPAELRDRLDWPVSGVLFDVAHNSFWPPSWGPRPASADEATQTARAHLGQVATMVPVYSHRYLPSGRGSYGHPVLSMYQTDIIVYGTDLADYIDHEFSRSGWSISADWTPPAMVPFWSEFLSLDGSGLPQTVAGQVAIGACDAVVVTDVDLAHRVRDRCRLTGRFVLRSGRVADEYFDKYQFEADPALLGELADAMAPLIPEGTEVLAGLEMGGIAVVTALGQRTGLPCAFVRKAAKP
jgi:hypothetical protein